MVLTFHLAGINNQNFLMRDEQTGTYWQQISGRAVSGPLTGRSLKLIHSDELTYGLWKAEQPGGQVLKDLDRDASRYSPRDWDVKMQKTPVVIRFEEQGMHPRDLVLGLHAGGSARAFPRAAVIESKLLRDRIGSEPVLLVVGTDGESVRAFRATVAGASEPAEFYRIDGGPGAGAPVMMDSQTGSRWNFQGCAVDGKLAGKCLEPIEAIADYWFDWRNYNPGTTIYRLPSR